VTLSLNTTSPDAPIYAELLGQREEPLPETQPGEFSEPPDYAVESLCRPLSAAVERMGDIAEAYREQAASVVADVKRTHDEAHADLIRQHHSARLSAKIVDLPRDVYMAEVEKFIEMIQAADVGTPQLEWFASMRRVLREEALLTGRLDGESTVVIEAVRPGDLEPQRGPAADVVIVDEPLTLRLHTAEPTPPPIVVTSERLPSPPANGDQMGVMPPRYYEALEQLQAIDQELYGQDDPEPTREIPALPEAYAARLAEERAVLEEDEFPDEFGPYLREQLKDPEFRKAYEGAKGVAVIANMLLLVEVDVTMADVEGWTVEQRAQAVEWAGMTHLRASDNDVVVPPRPSFLPCDGSLLCTAVEHKDDCFGPLGQAEVQFWACKDHPEGIVEWDGDLAVCMETGCERTNEKPREADGE
jgi:hypothetical protein